MASGTMRLPIELARSPVSDGDDSSAQKTRACDVDSPTWMPFSCKCSGDALGVWLSRHGLELVHRPHQASCFTEDATVALFCKAYKSMIKSFEADLAPGRLSKGISLLSKVPRTHNNKRRRPFCLARVFSLHEMLMALGLGLGLRLRRRLPAGERATVTSTLK